ncbi:predicted protein [Thalassiosira pseudonana CCMP1335]|uniref:NAD(P)-binding domain-containing protein n=1 Tax=Thalassiosira pseudonana TaxID=35128 RepID=B8BXX4_THAPS|nr:predicted protein [Thalassiosira pseudonana CCMP1335]EED94281.1 predicted protein [Thalassiosira pseudonana CCMP1335]
MKELSAMNESGERLPNLELVPASDTDRIETLLRETDALMIAVDDVGSVMDLSIIEYLLDTNKVGEGKMKRVVAMSRNLNGNGTGMLVSASKQAANSQVWDNSNAEAYKQYESAVKEAADKCEASWTIVRAGTLKGGACGENNEYPQYLAESYYEKTKTDIVTWQLLFDCGVRGVKIAKGDVLPGPGMKAVFTAIGTDVHDGDSGRCGVAEAMVKSLEFDNTANVDFGVGTLASREPPSDAEWKELFMQSL